LYEVVLAVNLERVWIARAKETTRSWSLERGGWVEKGLTGGDGWESQTSSATVKHAVLLQELQELPVGIGQRRPGGEASGQVDQTSGEVGFVAHHPCTTPDEAHQNMRGLLPEVR
jgi:hypothetical protein